MKNFIAAILIVLAGMMAFSSCNSCSKSKEDVRTDTVATFGKADTAEVLALTSKYLDYVKNQQYDEALAMLNNIVDDSVQAIDDEEKSKIKIQQQTFPVLDYHVADMDFVNENKVKITYAIEFFKKSNPADSVPNTIRVSFAPQRINGQWYLELLDRSVMN